MFNFIDTPLTSITWQGRDGLRKYNPHGTVIIIGAGGLGWWLTAALMRCDDITNDFLIYDNDNFEGGNGSKRLPIPARKSTLKVNELANWMMEWTLETTPKYLRDAPRKFTAGTLKYDVDNLALLVDCTDAPISNRKEIYSTAWEHGIPVVRGSYDGEMVTFDYVPPMSIVNDGGYNMIPNMAVTFAAAGMVAESVRRVLKGEWVKPFTYHFGPVWRSATGNENEKTEIEASIGVAVAQDAERRALIEQAITEGDPLVIDEETGEILGRASEFEEVEEEEEAAEENFFDEANLADEDDYDEDEAQRALMESTVASFTSAMRSSMELLYTDRTVIEPSLTRVGIDFARTENSFIEASPYLPRNLEMPLSDVDALRLHLANGMLDRTLDYTFGVPTRQPITLLTPIESPIESEGETNDSNQ